MTTDRGITKQNKMAELLNLRSWYDTAINVLFEFRNTVKTNTSHKCIIWMIYPNSYIEKHFGYTDAGNKMLICPNLMLIKFNPKPYYLEGVKSFFISSNQEDCLDLERLAKIADALTQEAVVSWKHLRTWHTLKVENIKGTINLNVLDHDYGADLSHKSFEILSTKTLEFLKEYPRSQLLIAMIASALIGGGILSFAYLILIIILVLITKFF